MGNPSEPYVPTGATIHEVDDNHCKSDNTGAIVGIVLGVLFCICCCVGVGVMLRKKRGRQTAQTVNKPQAPQLVQMTGTVQHNSVPNQTAYGNTMHNGSM